MLFVIRVCLSRYRNLANKKSSWILNQIFTFLIGSVIWNIINGIDFPNAPLRRSSSPCKQTSRLDYNLCIAPSLCECDVQQSITAHLECNECSWHQQCIRVKPQMEIIKVKFENLSLSCDKAKGFWIPLSNHVRHISLSRWNVCLNSRYQSNDPSLEMLSFERTTSKSKEIRTRFDGIKFNKV